MMPVVFTARSRLWSPQVVLCLMVAAGCVALLSSLNKAPKRRDTWSMRREQLMRYDSPEISIQYLRKHGHVDHQIEELSDMTIDTMNETALMVTVHSFLDNADTLCRRKIRMGYMGDGGWEICDDKEIRPKSPPCLIYSFGLVSDFAFEEDATRIYKCQVHAFNPYLPGTDFNQSSNVVIHPYGTGRYSEITSGGKELYTLEDIRSILGHTNQDIDVIKIDTENSEWSSLTHMISSGQLDRVRQLLVEFHIGFPPSLAKLRRAVKVLKSLSQIGFRKFYVHKNPKGSFHHPGFPVVRAKNYEVHYINTRFTDKKSEK